MMITTAIATRTPYYFPVTRFKLATMSVLTFGFYLFWWEFKNWLYVSDIKGKKVLPFIRSFFSAFFFYSLLREMNSSGEQVNFNGRIAPLRTYLLWLFFGFASNFSQVMDKVAVHVPTGSATTVCNVLSLLFTIVSAFSFLPALPIQKYINDLNLSTNAACEINSRFTKGNWALIAAGGLMWLLIFLGAVFGWVKSDC